MITGIAHVALYTPIFEETIEFYQKVFEVENLGFLKQTQEAAG